MIIMSQHAFASSDPCLVSGAILLQRLSDELPCALLIFRTVFLSQHLPLKCQAGPPKGQNMPCTHCYYAKRDVAGVIPRAMFARAPFTDWAHMGSLRRSKVIEEAYSRMLLRTSLPASTAVSIVLNDG